MSHDLPNLADLLEQEAATTAWLQAHGCTDLRCAPDSAANGARHVDEDKAYEQRAAAWLAQHAPTLADRLPLGAPVVFPNGVHGVVVDYSTLSSQRYEIAWFDRRFWRVNRRCFDRAQFVVYDGAAENAAVETAALSA